MNITQEVNPPTMPGTYTVKQQPGLRQGGASFTNERPITDFSREEAEQFGEMMKQEFIKHWETKTADASFQ